MTDAVVVGSGPNGLAAAIELQRAGLDVLLLEGADAIGGAARTAELTLPGFRHDVCAAALPLAVSSPYLRKLPLAAHGVRWVHAPAELAHPLPDTDEAALLWRDVDATAARLGRDGDAWRALFAPLAAASEALFGDALAPLHVPRHPLLLGRFGLAALQPVTLLARRFRDAPAKALFAGIAAHAAQPLDGLASSAVGMMLATAGHAGGWPLIEGGTGRLVEALAALFVAGGGRIETGRLVRRLADVPAARVTLLDVTPRQLLAIAGDALPSSYARRLARYRYGPGVFKIDWALAAPIPWRAPDCRRAATVHLGGTLEDMTDAFATLSRGALPRRPFVLLTQPTLFDATRAPEGRHIAWAYCHVPNGSAIDATQAIEATIERYAPGFGDVVLARATRDAPALERYNPSCVGGDISGGAVTATQLLTRPVSRWDPYGTPRSGLYLCSSSTPPGAGVHGMSGFHAARSALRFLGVAPRP